MCVTSFPHLWLSSCGEKNPPLVGIAVVVRIPPLMASPLVVEFSPRLLFPLVVEFRKMGFAVDFPLAIEEWDTSSEEKCGQVISP